MRPTPSRDPRSPWLATTLMLCLGSASASAADTYNPQTQQLLIPAVTVGNASFTNVIVGITQADIVVAPTGPAPFFNVDTYNPVNNELTVPTVNVGGATYFNAVVKVGSLISIGGVTGADSYNAGVVTIPEVQVGNVIYTNVVVTISSIQSRGGGMPNNSLDVYNSSNHQLSVAAVEAGGAVFTNALVTPGTIRSVGGQLPVYSTVYSFGPAAPDHNDSNYPYGGLIQGADGNFYGAAQLGGTNGFGTVFKLSPAGVESIVYSFGPRGSGDAQMPSGGLIQGSDGTFYGTAGGGATGNGAVFKVTPQGVEHVIYSFAGGSDAAAPNPGLVLDAAGNLYGTTAGGGAHAFGTVYKVTPQGAESVLWSFADRPDGGQPSSNLILWTDGNFYGTTTIGGTAGEGTAFRITPAGSLTVLHSFGATASDGVFPNGLTQGPDGNFYGTTTNGGAFSGSYAGTVFKMTPAGAVTILHSFSGYPTPAGIDGSNPEGTLFLDGNLNIYGTTYDGGKYSSGILFKITPAGKETILYTNGRAGVIAGNTDGNFIQSGLILGTDGNLYGNAPSGGANQTGVVFKLSGAFTAH